MDAYIGEVRIFGFNYAPQNWALCQGQLLSIMEHTTVFALLGTTYGGDGRTTFGLPDLRGRVPVGQGSGPGRYPRYMGQYGGSEDVTLSVANLPSHTHAATTELTLRAKCSTGEGDSENPVGNLPATAEEGAPYSTGSAAGDMDGAAVQGTAVTTIANTGSGQAFDNHSPFQVLNYCICLSGVWPPRP